MRVRIVIEHPFLGGVEVEEEEPVMGIDGDRARKQIDRLIEQAAGKIRRAYEIEEQQQ